MSLDKRLSFEVDLTPNYTNSFPSTDFKTMSWKSSKEKYPGTKSPKGAHFHQTSSNTCEKMHFRDGRVLKRKIIKSFKFEFILKELIDIT